MKTEQLYDNIGVELELGRVFRLQCCDCGLTHEVVIVTDESSPGTFGLALKVNKKATASKRRWKRARGWKGIR